MIPLRARIGKRQSSSNLFITVNRRIWLISETRRRSNPNPMLMVGEKKSIICDSLLDDFPSSDHKIPWPGEEQKMKQKSHEIFIRIDVPLLLFPLGASSRFVSLTSTSSGISFVKNKQQASALVLGIKYLSVCYVCASLGCGKKSRPLIASLPASKRE